MHGEVTGATGQDEGSGFVKENPVGERGLAAESEAL